jgi:hypothetical protein
MGIGFSTRRLRGMRQYEMWQPTGVAYSRLEDVRRFDRIRMDSTRNAVRAIRNMILMLALTSSDAVLPLAEAARQAPTGAAAIRGSWVTERDGAHYIYIFAVHGDRISGVACARCFDLNNLAFVADGRVEGDALSFTLLHDRGDGRTYRETFRGTAGGGRIALTASREGATQQSAAVTLRRPAANAAALLAEGRRSGGPEPYMTSGPPEPLTPEKVLGVWRAPMGPTAYLLKQVGDRILGLACDAKCEDGSYSAFIETAAISRNTLLVSIAHVDAAGEPTANLLTLYLSKGRLTGTYVNNTRPDRRNNFVWVRQYDPDAPKEAVWRGAFDEQP